MIKEKTTMKNYHHCIVMENGEFYRESVTTNESAEQQGERLWKTIPGVLVVDIREDCGEDWGKDCYLRNQ